MIQRLAPQPAGSDIARETTKRRPESAEPAWRKDSAGAPRGRRHWRFVVAGTGLLAMAALLVWASTWLRPPSTTGLVLLGADYGENLLVPHNSHGWHVLEDMADLANDRQLQCWGKQLFQLVHPPLELRAGGVWDRSLNTCSQRTILIYIAAHGGVDDRGPYLLPNDARAQGESSRLRLTVILDRIEKLSANQHKILILDCTALVAEWSLGMLENDFARSLESLDSRIASIPNLVVISASGRDERSWADRSWRQTVFGHYVLEGLRGKVDDSNHDGRIDVWDLYASVRRTTQQWAQVNRAARQTPEIFPSGDAGYRRARRMDLVPVACREQSPTKPPVASFKVPEEIDLAWQACQRLANRVPNPAVYSPIYWRRYRDLLLRYEALILAGNRTAAARIHQRMMESQARIDRVSRQDVPSIQNSIAMYETMMGNRPALSNADPQKVLEDLWNVAPEQRAMKWDASCVAAGNRSSARQQLRITLQDMILRRVSEDPPANLQRGSELIKLLDDPLYARPAESHFLVMLNRDLPKSTWDDQRRDLIRLALDTRLLAERTAWCRRNAGYAYPERVAPGMRPLVEEADTQRRTGEDLLFGNADDRARAQQHLQQARRLYQQAGKHGNVVSKAIDAYVRTMANLPYYARWIARRRPDLRNDRATHQNWLARFELICQNTHQLGTTLATFPNKQQRENDQLTNIASETDAVIVGLQQFEESLRENWQMLVAADSPQAWCDLNNALCVPRKQPRLRMKLLAGLFRTEQRLATESTQRLARHVRVTRQQQTDCAKWTAQAEGRMALATLGRGGYQLLTENNGPSYDELQHRLAVFAVEEQWWRSVAVAGHALGDAWCRVPKVVDRQSKEADEHGRSKGLEALMQAEQLSRLLPGYCELNVHAEPADVARRARLQELFLWQARRAYDNHWYAEDPESEPYYRVVARSYLDGVTALLKKWPVDKKLRQQLTAITGLEFSVAKRLDMSTERQLQVPVRLTTASAGGVPAGSPVVWFEVGSSLTLSSRIRDRSAWRWKPAEKMQPVICDIGSPALDQAERQPPSLPKVIETQLVLHGIFRGQILASNVPTHLHLAPELTIASQEPPERASVAVRADEALHRQYGDGNGAVAIVLDCTGSMGPPAGQPFSAHMKYAEATRVLAQVLARLPYGTTLSVWVFGQAVGPAKTVAAPETTVTRILDPVRWDPNHPAQLNDLMARIQYPALEPWNESPIVRAILAAKQDLKTAQGFKTIVVLTDGIDNRVAGDKQINPDGEEVPSLLRKSFRGSGIELNIVGFRMAEREESLGWKQFHVVQSLSPPGVFCTVRQSDALAKALDAALRQRITYRIDTNADRQVKADPARELDVSRSGANDQWYPNGLEPGNYRIEMNTVQRLEGRIALNQGDRLLMRLASAKGELKLERVVFGKEDFAWKPFKIGAGWRATVLQNQLVGNGGLQLLLGLEPNGEQPGSSLSLARPEMTWIELSPREPTTDGFLVRSHCCWGYPLAACRLTVPSWPTDQQQQLASPRLKIWWSFEQCVSSDVVLRRPGDFRALDDLTGREISTNGLNVRLQSVTVEDHLVQTGPDRREMRTCLVVRLGYPPSHTLWAKPGGIHILGQEHRYYRKIGRYAGLFWPVTKDAVDASLTHLELIRLDTFQRSAEARGNMLEFDKLPKPDANDVGPRPTTSLP